MIILTSVVLSSPYFLIRLVPNNLHGSSIRTQSVSEDYMWFSLSFHNLLRENQDSFKVTSLSNKGFEYFSLMINSTPEIMCYAIDLHEDFIKTPFPV